MSVRRNLALVVSTILVAGVALTGCASDGGDSAAETTTQAQPTGLFAEAKARNTSKTVDERFPTTPHVLSDEDFSGVSASQMFLEKSETAIVTGPTMNEQLRGASLSVASYAPMFRMTPENRQGIIDELGRLGAHTVLAVGDADLTGINPKTTVITDDFTDRGIEELIALKLDRVPVEAPEDVASAVAGLGAENTVQLVPSFEALSPHLVKTPEDPHAKRTELHAFPIQSARDGGMAPVVLAWPGTAVAAIANARVYGAEVHVLPYPDPRVSKESMELVAGLADRPLIALGSAFGTGEFLAEEIRFGEKERPRLATGTPLALPGQRMVALYGHQLTPVLGVMGEQPPAESVERVKELVAQYQEFSDEPVVPAFEIIATVASGGPGPDGNYSNESAPEELVGYIDAITDAGGYAVIDLQPGRATFLEQAKLYEELLKRPNVGLALDSEWRIGPDELPMQRIGSADAAEINEVSEWLAQLVERENLPQKLFVLHQFQLAMLPDRENIDTLHPELAFVLHADGHGVPEQKFDTWNVLRQDLDPRYFMAWKNFIDEDMPTFTPEQTMTTVVPQPWFVSYQ